MDSNKIICIARGGLGNRLKSIYSCYALAKKYNKEFIIDWGINQSFQAKFLDIFRTNLKIDNYYKYVNNKSILVAEKDTVKIYFKELIYPIKLITPNKFNIDINFDGNILIFYPDYLPIISGQELIEATNQIKFSEYITSIANKFNIDNSIFNTLGVHIRLTDFERNKIKFNDYERIIFKLINNNNKNKIFICSDSSEAESELFEKYGNNLVYYKKNNQPNKINDKLSWANNIERNRNSIIDSCIDLLILSNSKICYYNKDSTFAHIALLLSRGKVINNRRFLFRKFLEKIL